MRRLPPVLLTAILLAGLLPLQALAAAPPVLTLPVILAAVDELTQLAFTATATDDDDDPLTFDLAPGAGGSVPVGAAIDRDTGAFAWTPTESQGPGSYTFDVTVSDGALVDTETITVTVNEVDLPPVLEPIGPQSVAEGATMDIALAATDGDLPAQELSFSLGTGAPAWVTLIGSTLYLAPDFGDGSADISVCVSDGPLDDCETVAITVTNTNRAPAFDADLGDRTSAEGAVISLDAGATDPDGDPLTYAATGLPAGLSISTATGLISGTIGHTAAAASPYDVSVTVRDGPTVDATDTFSWTVTNTNRAPAFDADLGDRTSAEGAVISLDAGATDPDGDPLTYAATGLPAGLSISTATGLISGTIGHTAAAASPYDVSVTVRDGPTVDATDTFSWTVTNTNRAPAFDADLGDRTSAEGAVISLDAGATDPDGDPLTYAATGLPAGLSISTATGLISGTIGHTAAAASPYDVSVTVRDGPTVDATDTFSWTVTNTNRAPAFDADLGDRTSAEGAVISLDAGATDPDGDPLTYAATGLPAGLSISTATGLISGTIGHTAAAASPYDVSVTVRDGPTVDATDTFSWTVTNTNRAPAFDADLGDRTSAEGAVISLDAGATDPDGDPLTYAATGLPAGLSISTATGLISGTIGHTAAAASPYDVSVTVRDGPTVDATDTFSWTVTNTNRAPAFDADLGDRTSAEGAVISLDAGATDPDGDPLTYAATGLPAGLSISTATGLISGTIGHTAAAASPYDVSVTVRDGPTVDATDTFSWTVTNTNRAPIGNAQSVTTNEDTAKAITLAGTDLDGNPLNYTVLSQPAHGTLSGTGATRTYTPAANYNGPDSFTFRVSDGVLNSATATVSITVAAVNDAPIANAQSVTTNEDTAKAITLAGTDLDGNPLNYTVLSQPAHGTLSGTGATRTYTPAANYNGPDSFTFRVSDGLLNSATATVSITVAAVNDAPIARTDGFTVNATTAATLAVLANDYSGPVVSGATSEPTDAIIVKSVGTASRGTISIAAGGTGVVYDPTGCGTGGDSFTYTITDSRGLTATATAFVTIARPGANGLSVNPITDMPATGLVSNSTIGSTVPVRLSWCGVTSGTTIDAYRLYQSINDGSYTTRIDKTTATSSTRSVSVSPTRHQFQIRVKDRKSRYAYGTGPDFRVGRYQNTQLVHRVLDGLVHLEEHQALRRQREGHRPPRAGARPSPTRGRGFADRGTSQLDARQVQGLRRRGLPGNGERAVIVGPVPSGAVRGEPGPWTPHRPHRGGGWRPDRPRRHPHADGVLSVPGPGSSCSGPRVPSGIVTRAVNGRP